ncbi:hypothetical protein SDC9_185743 [bioreactor metagenome]|uniref:Uncharacterized protein n=1 Tax=bioreactor metagenome TaxID=1076179 RepID=A0A645HJ45_9ZZZZ
MEQETNGFITYDREVVKMDKTRVCAVNARLSDEPKPQEDEAPKLEEIAAPGQEAANPETLT